VKFLRTLRRLKTFRSLATLFRAYRLLLEQYLEPRQVYPTERPPKWVFIDGELHYNLDEYSDYLVGKKLREMRKRRRPIPESALRFFSVAAFMSFVILLVLPTQAVNILIAPAGAYAIALIVHAVAVVYDRSKRDGAIPS